jgi:hypothetical protein
MLETEAKQLTIADPDETDTAQADTQAVPQTDVRSHYDQAKSFALEDYEYPVPGFVDELCSELGKDLHPEDAKLVDTVEPSSDIDDGLLVAYPDESLMFIGLDPTAKDTMGWYAFTIEAMEPMPAPETAKEALDLLKPPEVQDIVETENWTPNRHGEWWLLPAEIIPRGRVHKSGVKSRPYGPSPLGNHVPREYAFSKPDDEFVEAFKQNVESAPNSLKSPPEIIEWSFRQQNKKPSVRPDDAPSWADIREWAGDVLVKGTIRHRDDDHYIEDCGEMWHKAVTHRVEVYTTDGIGEGVHLDYYGQT